MQVVVNGETTETDARTIAELLDRLGLAGRPVAVERNRSVVPKRAHADTPLAAGDRLELVTLVGGG
ncbi:MAG: sulfur carrier protein ThiS [Planctomycetota bacterium]